MYMVDGGMQAAAVAKLKKKAIDGGDTQERLPVRIRTGIEVIAAA